LVPPLSLVGADWIRRRPNRAGYCQTPDARYEQSWSRQRRRKPTDGEYRPEGGGRRLSAAPLRCSSRRQTARCVVRMGPRDQDLRLVPRRGPRELPQLWVPASVLRRPWTPCLVLPGIRSRRPCSPARWQTLRRCFSPRHCLPWFPVERGVHDALGDWITNRTPPSPRLGAGPATCKRRGRRTGSGHLRRDPMVAGCTCFADEARAYNIEIS
jgi:hypothetical protein